MLSWSKTLSCKILKIYLNLKTTQCPCKWQIWGKRNLEERDGQRITTENSVLMKRKVKTTKDGLAVTRATMVLFRRSMLTWVFLSAPSKWKEKSSLRSIKILNRISFSVMPSSAVVTPMREWTEELLSSNRTLLPACGLTAIRIPWSCASPRYVTPDLAAVDWSATSIWAKSATPDIEGNCQLLSALTVKRASSVNLG